jgi:hypothetical protein
MCLRVVGLVKVVLQNGPATEYRADGYQRKTIFVELADFLKRLASAGGTSAAPQMVIRADDCFTALALKTASAKPRRAALFLKVILNHFQPAEYGPDWNQGMAFVSRDFSYG